MGLHGKRQKGWVLVWISWIWLGVWQRNCEFGFGPTLLWSASLGTVFIGVSDFQGPKCPRDVPDFPEQGKHEGKGPTLGNVNPGLVNPWWINRGMSPFGGDSSHAPE